ncbi:MAG: hypothetical protein ACQ9ET_00140 [Nitrosomonadaceae bacterium]
MKRLKKVFTSSDDVMHLFAQKSQTDARCTNVFFEPNYFNDNEYGEIIYSYGKHYKLGEFLNSDTIMINDTSYSVTTSKHARQLQWATNQYKQFFISQTDINEVYSTIMSNKNKLARANKPELYITPILNLWETLNEYAEFDRKSKKVLKKDYLLYSEDKYKEIKSLVNALNNDTDGLKAKLSKHAKLAAKRQKAKEAKRIRTSLKEFFEYEIRTFRIGTEDYIRISKDGENIETSQGVKVPVKEAKVLYSMIIAGRDIKGHKIGYYTVTSINGTLKIGCHSINVKNMHEIGKQL